MGDGANDIAIPTLVGIMVPTKKWNIFPNHQLLPENLLGLSPSFFVALWVPKHKWTDKTIISNNMRLVRFPAFREDVPSSRTSQPQQAVDPDEAAGFGGFIFHGSQSWQAKHWDHPGGVMERSSLGFFGVLNHTIWIHSDHWKIFINTQILN